MTFNLQDAKGQLSRAPLVLQALVEPLPESWLHATEGPGTWPPIQVLRHLVWGEVDDWIPRARLILAHQDRVAFTPFDREAGEGRYAGWPAGVLVDEFGRLRAANLETLEGMNLGGEHLALQGLHPSLGRVTMSQLLATWVAHDLVHLTQITRTLARQYTDAVGPWREFMSVLKAEV
ncbi:MAG: DinB family protein [Vicinamibacteria bacterium]|nr:DinB family protein [Vicinamibacteria bacterium]